MINLTEIRNAIIGKTRDEAYSFLEKAEIKHRVTKVDGMPRVITADFNPDRINLHLENSIVVDLTMG